MSARPANLGRSLRALRRTAARFWPQIRPQRALIGGATLAILLEALMRLAEPWPLKFVLDRVIVDTPAGGGSGLPFLDGLSDTALLAVCAAAVALAAALRALFAYLSQVGLALAGNRVLTEVRGLLFAHVQRLSLRFHSGARGGDLLTRLTGDVGRLQEVTVTAALPLAANVLTLVGMVVVMALLDWQLALVALAVFPLCSPALLRLGTRIRSVSREQRAREGELASSAAEAIGAIKVVQALSLEDRVEREFAARNAASLKEGVQAKRLAAGLERRVDVLVGIGTAGVLFVGARRVQAGALTPGDLVVFLMYLKAAFKPMRDLAKYAGRLARAAASGERILELLDQEPDVRDRPGARPAPPLRGHVRLRDVRLAYADGAPPALDGVDLEVEPGQRVVLVGPSGAGKSSLLALLPRLYDVDGGAVELDGHDVRDLRLASLRAQIAVVLQESVLFAASVRDNIAYGAPGATHAEVEEAARVAGAHEFIQRLPQGYDTVLGERGATLSGGQRQRLAIARAAVRRAPIVLLDEPTAGLDEHTERAVQEALHRLCADRTTFVVAHGLEAAVDADLVVHLDGGRIVETGTHEELLAAGGAYAATWALQQARRGGRAAEAVA
jgi:ATP-binding cassette subfamily B protein